MAKTILILAANPLDTNPLRLQQEAQQIKDSLKSKKKFKIEYELTTTPFGMQKAILEYKPQIVHFCGHGTGAEGIVLEDEARKSAFVSTEALTNLFKLFDKTIECVVFNACYSEVQAIAIAQHIPYVVGMNWAIGDEAAIKFAAGFYIALGAGESVEFAHQSGCVAIQMANIPEHLTPVLIKQAELPPDPLPPAQSSPPNHETRSQPVSTIATVKPAKSLHVTILYKRRAQPDEQLLEIIEKQLTEAGHEILIDRHLKIDEEWEKETTHNIKNADAVVILLSPTAIYSEMLAHEIEIAYKTAQETGKLRLLPVRINFEDSFPPELATILSPLPSISWRNEQDSASLMEHLLAKLTKSPPLKLRPLEQLEAVGGAVPLGAKFYVERPVDQQFKQAILRRDTIVLLKGARQVGKTSLLARGLDVARQQGFQIVFTDFQKFIDTQLKDLESFFIAVGEMLADELDLEQCPLDVWRKNRAPNTNFERYFRQSVLANVGGSLLWAMDEADRLFHCPFGSEVFALFRTWHNERAINPSSPCNKLTMAIAYATESYLFIKDQNQSPFNVGTKLELRDFTFAEVADLNQRYGSPLQPPELQQFFDLVGGHPYLVRCGLNEIVVENLDISTFAMKVDQDDGIFSDHLRRIIVLLEQEPKLREVVREILKNQPCPDNNTFYRLRSSGLLKGESKNHAQFRCEVYRRYLQKHL